MNKKVVITIISVVVLALVVVGIILGVNYYNKSQITDSERFSSEYTKVEKDNLFVYDTIDEIIKVLEHGTGVVYLGFPDCPWCQEYVPMLNDIAQELEIDKIHYFNILEDRKNNTEEYQKIVSLLEGNLLFDADGNPRIYVPDVTVVKEGTIIGHDNEGSLVTEEDGTPEEYWTVERRVALKTRLANMISEISDSNCSSCDK